MNRGMDEFRVARMQEQMEQAGLDYLVLRLAENVLYTTGYWPIFGASAAIFPREGEPSILFVEGEQEFVQDTWVEDVEPYKFFTLESLASPQRDITAWIRRKWQEKGYDSKATIGYEGDFELVGSNNVAAEARVIAPSSGSKSSITSINSSTSIPASNNTNAIDMPSSRLIGSEC